MNKRGKWIISVVIVLIIIGSTSLILYYVLKAPEGNNEPSLITTLAITQHDKVLGQADQYQINIENTGNYMARFSALSEIQIIKNSTEELNPTSILVGAVIITFPYDLNAGESVVFVLQMDAEDAFIPGINYIIKIVLADGVTTQTNPFTY